MAAMTGRPLSPFAKSVYRKVDPPQRRWQRVNYRQSALSGDGPGLEYET